MRPDVVGVELWSVDLPLPNPVQTVIGPIEQMAVLAVRASAGDGATGCGYASFPTPSLRDATIEHARRLLSEDAVRADLRAAETVAAATSGALQSEEELAAASALSIAGWDRYARANGVGCAEVWGRDGGSLPTAYGSGMFLGATEAELVEEARAFRSAGFRAVKMRVGGDPEVDAERVAAVQSVYDSPASVAVDAYETWTSTQANRFLRGLREPLLWFEDPTPIGELPSVDRGPCPLAAGERCRSVRQVLELTEILGPGGVLMLDVQSLGGPSRFLDCARAVQHTGGVVGAHVFPTVSLSLLAAVAPESPVEVLGWWDRLFDAAVRPDGDGRAGLLGPGLGAQLDDEALARWGRVLQAVTADREHDERQPDDDR